MPPTTGQPRRAFVRHAILSCPGVSAGSDRRVAPPCLAATRKMRTCTRWRAHVLHTAKSTSPLPAGASRLLSSPETCRRLPVLSTWS